MTVRRHVEKFEEMITKNGQMTNTEKSFLVNGTNIKKPNACYTYEQDETDSDDSTVTVTSENLYDIESKNDVKQQCPEAMLNCFPEVGEDNRTSLLLVDWDDQVKARARIYRKPVRKVEGPGLKSLLQKFQTL